jgi:hypothetical protein
MIQKNVMLPEEGFDPATGHFRRRNQGLKRWIRGFFAQMCYVDVLNVRNRPIENLINAFAMGQTNSLLFARVR